MKTPIEKHIQSRTKRIFWEVNILKRDENNHTIIDISRLKSIPDEELRNMRHVGNATVEFINNFRNLFDWI
ncbi:MAG: hypothetical protein EGP82_00255 [Odoribacter splanchnicus]|nr:hypothetical protein [Odoribacter splanchnicus]